jgi:hypothetical protein
MRRFVLFAGSIVVALAGAAHADVNVWLSSDVGTNIVSSPTSTTTVPIDVYVTSTGVDYLAAYDVAVTASPSSATFGAALTAPLDHSALFQNDLTNYGNATEVEAADYLPSGQTQITGDAGLLCLKLMLPVGASGTYTVSFDGANTALFDGTSPDPPVTVDSYNDLTLDVSTSPEPTSLSLLAAAIVPLTGGRRRRAPRPRGIACRPQPGATALPVQVS